MDSSLARVAALSPLLLLAACASSGLSSTGTAIDEGAEESPTVAFEAAEYATGVPAELLMAIAQAETGLQWIQGEEEFPGQPTAHGLMALREVSLGAELAGLTEEEVRQDRTANVLAAASVLALWADELDIDTSDLDAWAPVVAEYSGITDPDAAAEYVHEHVYAALGTGISVEGVRVAPIAVAPDYPPATALRSGDGGAIWTPSPNFNSRSGKSPEYVVIHTCEGSYSGCWSWLVNSASGVSAHYVVNETGTEVRQLVQEEDRAWHVSASYDCDLNSGVDCGNDGTSINTLGVGIEHAGYGSQSSWNPGLIQRSAEVTCGVTDRWGIPRDSYHVLGHGQVQPWNRSDPGANWPWTDYLAKVQAACGDTGGGSSGGSSGGATGSTPSAPTTGTQIVIDSNNSANDTASYYTEVGTGWWASTNVAGYYNTGYWVAPTSPTSDPVSFWFYADTEACWSVEGWWTSAWDRYDAVAYIGWDEWDNEVARSIVDQTTDGSQWNHLGDWTFPAGWNRVLVSRWASAGNYVVADAVRLTEGCP